MLRVGLEGGSVDWESLNSRFGFYLFRDFGTGGKFMFLISDRKFKLIILTF